MRLNTANSIAVAAAAALLLLPTCLRGQTAWYEGFEGADPTWKAVGGDAQYRIEQHERVRGEAHTGRGSESIALRGSQGTYVYLQHEVGRPRVIDELMPTVWVKSDRSGLQLLARVVLPRTEDPRTGGPISTLVQGSSYKDVGRWQQLRITDIPQLLASRIRVLRAELGPSVDGREAYVEHILLNAYGGPGTTNLWIDDLDVAGSVPSLVTPVPTVGEWVGSRRTTKTKPRRIELAGSVLTVDGRPMFPRMVLHQGESLALLKRLGFNTIWLRRAASPEILQEAAQLGLWLVSPPPRWLESPLPNPSLSAVGEIGPAYDPVLAWDLGWALSGEELRPVTTLAERLRSADRRHWRPLVCMPHSDLRAYSRQTDLLLIDRRPLGTSLEMADYGNWVRRQPLLARPGTRVWTTVQTQPARTLREQLRALQPSGEPPSAVSIEQMRLLVHTAVASGSRGLLFVGESPLDAADPQTRRRATALELLNLELQLIEPWAAAGSFVGTAESTRPEVFGAVLRTDRSRLLLPMWFTPGAQYVPGQSASHGLSLVVPGIPESNGAHVLTPGGLRPLLHKRVTGGMRVTLEEFGLTGQVLIAQDPLVVSELTRRAVRIGPRAAELTRQLAVQKLESVQNVVSQLARPGAAARQVDDRLITARKSLQWCDGYLAAKNYQAACLHARRTMRSLRLVERTYWQAAIQGIDSPVAYPGAVSFATLPWHGQWLARIAASRAQPNRLAGGDFEHIQSTLGSGWRHFQHGVAGLQTAADLTADAAHGGRAGLRLVVRAEEPANAPAVVETPPIWLTSPPLRVEPDQLLRIAGWVNIPTPITGSVDGLMILDSLTGAPLAQRIGQTKGWQQFTLYRMAPHSGEMTLSFALTGLGEVYIDDVTIQVMAPPTGTMTQRTAPGGSPH